MKIVVRLVKLQDNEKNGIALTLSFLKNSANIGQVVEIKPRNAFPVAISPRRNDIQ